MDGTAVYIYRIMEELNTEPLDTETVQSPLNPVPPLPRTLQSTQCKLAQVMYDIPWHLHFDK